MELVSIWDKCLIKGKLAGTGSSKLSNIVSEKTLLFLIFKWFKEPKEHIRHGADMHVLGLAVELYIWEYHHLYFCSFTRSFKTCKRFTVAKRMKLRLLSVAHKDFYNTAPTTCLRSAIPTSSSLHTPHFSSPVLFIIPWIRLLCLCTFSHTALSLWNALPPFLFPEILLVIQVPIQIPRLPWSLPHLKVQNSPSSVRSIVWHISIVAPSTAHFLFTAHSICILSPRRVRAHWRQTLSCYHCSRCSIKCLLSE